MVAILADTLVGVGLEAYKRVERNGKMPRKSEAGSLFGKHIVSAVDLLFTQGIVVTAVKVKYPGIDPLLIIQAKTTEGPKIAFVGGRDLDDIGDALGKLVRTDSMKWREDEWEMRRVAGKLDNE